MKLFNRNKTMTVATRVENEDCIKVQRLIDTYKLSKTIVEVHAYEGGRVTVTFNMLKSLDKSFRRDLKILSLIGIICRVED